MSEPTSTSTHESPKVQEAIRTLNHNLRVLENLMEDGIARTKALIERVMRDDSAEVAAVERAAVEVAEAGFAAAEPALEALAETAVHAAVESGAVAIEGAVPVLAPAIEAGAVAVDKAADSAIDAGFTQVAKVPSDGQTTSQ